MRFSTFTSLFLVLVAFIFAFANAQSSDTVGSAIPTTGSVLATAGSAVPTSASSSATRSASATKTSAAAAKTTKAKTLPGNFAYPPILEGGTLFYIGVAVTTFLWFTGKAIDIQTERQERHAERVANQS